MPERKNNRFEKLNILGEEYKLNIAPGEMIHLYF